VLLAFATFDYIVVPLSWCTAMVKPFFNLYCFGSSTKC